MEIHIELNSGYVVKFNLYLSKKEIVMESNENMSETIDLSRLFKAVKADFKGIVVWTIVGLVVALTIAFLFVTPKYSSNVDFLVNQKSEDSQTQYTTQQADLGAINTYKDVLEKSVILNPVLKEQRQENNYKGSLKDLQNAIDISNAQGSQVISVTVTDKNSYVAADIANNIADVFNKKIKKMMKIDNVTIVTKARADNQAVSPNKKIYAAVGLLVGFLIGIAIAVFKEFLNNTVQNSDFVTDELGLTNLGRIYHIKKDEHNFRIVHVLNNQGLQGSEGRNKRRV